MADAFCHCVYVFTFLFIYLFVCLICLLWLFIYHIHIHDEITCSKQTKLMRMKINEYRDICGDKVRKDRERQQRARTITLYLQNSNNNLRNLETTASNLLSFTPAMRNYSLKPSFIYISHGKLQPQTFFHLLQP